MDWQQPQALYLILPLCVAWLVLTVYSERRRRSARLAFAAQAMWSRVLPEESSVRFWSKLALREIAIIFGLVALAGPRFGTQYEQVIPRGSDLYVLIDVSRSMLADDVPPSRLGRAKADVSALLNRLEGERVGLIAFAGQAVVKCPLTIDYDSFRRALDELDPDSAPRGGTAIGDAIRKSLEVFQPNAERDQAILLITDGDDQESYPLEAADVAAERHVTIFTVGLGDAERGARIPQKGSTTSFMEHQGEQVWSKLDGNLLQQIALKTKGIYVPAGTRAYDLGELYTNHLQGRRGSDSASQQRIRRSEQFQIFLAIALAALLIDLCVGSYRRTASVPKTGMATSSSRPVAATATKTTVKQSTVLPLWGAMFVFLSGSIVGFAAEPDAAIREGLRLYSQDKFGEARERFAAASEQLDKDKSAAAAIAAFDEACAAHRQGEQEKARDAYLRAGLSQDRKIATSAHFNLGNLSAEKARTLAGDHPETIPQEKRKEILDELQLTIVAYRHCLELQPEHVQARRNLELVRQWVKHYTDEWRRQDRQKRRDESNLLAFLEFLIQTESGMREMTNQLPPNTRANAFAELKRAQDELREEIPTLREKIANELKPPQQQGAPAPSAEETKQIEEGITLLQGWCDAAGDKMYAASRQLHGREAAKAATEQQSAVDELDKIWDAVIPFHPLLAKELGDQTVIARTLDPKPAEANVSAESSGTEEKVKTDDDKQGEKGNSEAEKEGGQHEHLQIAEDDLLKLAEIQERTLRKARLLAPKAQAELERLEVAPPAQAINKDDPAAAQQQPPVDPEEAKQGFRTAIELGPKAVEQMEAATTSLKKKDRLAASQSAEEARKILEEIQKAQPKQKQDQNKQDQQNKDDQNQQQNQNKSDEEKKKDEQKKEDEKDKEKKSDEQKKNEENKQKEQQKQQQAKVSPDRIEDALRKVREREQEKRERDRKLKGQVLGRTPVDKDW